MTPRLCECGCGAEVRARFVFGHQRRRPEIPRFWAKVDKSGGPDACWLWTGYRLPDGYGRFRSNDGLVLAHRFAYSISVGPIPDGLEIDHRCHQHSCVNPAHLRPATRAQNQQHKIGPRADGKSGHLGVAWEKSAGKWRVRVCHNGIHHSGGLFDDVEAAAIAARDLRLQLFTHNDADRAALGIQTDHREATLQ